MSDLDDRLRSVDDQLRTLTSSAPPREPEDVDQQAMQNERENIQQCLDICARVSSHIEEVQSTTFKDINVPADGDHTQVRTSGVAASSRLATNDALQHCKDTLITASSQLRRHLEDVYRRLDALGYARPTDSTEQRKMQEEIDSIKQSISICADASNVVQDRTSTYDRVTLTDDGHQVVVSTVGDLINARDISAGARSAQWLGQMSDDSLQHLSQNRTKFAPEIFKPEEAPKFEERYGQGRNLKK